MFDVQDNDLYNNIQVKFWVSLFAFSLVTIVAMGRTGGDIFAYGLWLYLSLYVLKRFSNKIFLAYLIFTFIISSVYLPVAIFYGRLDMGVVASLYETNLSESSEFISMLDIKSYLALIIYLLLFIAVLQLNKKFINNNNKKSKKFYSLTIILILAIVVNPITQLYKKKSLVECFHGIDYYPLQQFAEFLILTHEYFSNKRLLKKSLELSPTWQFKQINPQYDTYVLVIGESVRRDYMSAYGYPINSTPFLKTVNATVFNNYISPSCTTRESLERTLFQNKDINNVVYSNNIISLANAVGMESYWLSNQGRYGNYDILASAVGFRANHIKFLTDSEFENINNSDLSLLPLFNESLADNTNKKKLIVLHLMGSHPRACKRIDPHYNIKNITNYISPEMSCYLSSLKQTDKLLEIIYKQLKESNKSFSLMYVADHGLAHITKNSEGKMLAHKPDYKENYQVPLMVMSSDDTERKYINGKKSGFQFVNGFAQWLGVQEKSLALKAPFFSEASLFEPIKVYNGKKVVDYQSLQDDPAITE